MEILVLGLNHKLAPLEIREKLSVPPHKTTALLDLLGERQIFDERLLLSTCNRTEIYGVGQRLEQSVERAKEFLSEYSSLPITQFEDKLYVLRQPESIEHLFSVASGLDSMVVGETEIIGQVKDAYLLAQKANHTGKVLNKLFQRSLKVAKDLRTQTDIGTGRVSVASIAIDLSEKIFESLKGVKVMIIGTGEMAAQLARALLSRGASAMIVSSHHFDRAQELAAQLGGEALHYDHYEGRIKEVDILITSTLAPLVLIHEHQVKSWMKLRQEKPLFLIDIAVPRNIEGAVEKLDNVYLYNMDDLQGIANRNVLFRESQLEDCFHLVKHQTKYFMDWFFKECGPMGAGRSRESAV